jgi:hypothetical protein
MSFRLNPARPPRHRLVISAAIFGVPMPVAMS